MSAALVTASGLIYKFASDTLGAEKALINLSDQTEVSVEKIQELNFVASLSGSSAEAVSSSLLGLAEKIGSAAQRGSADFSRLGLSVRDASGKVKGVDKVLAEISSRFNTLNLSIYEKRSFAQALGIDPTLIRMLTQTSSRTAELINRARALGLLNKKQIEQARQYNSALKELNFGLDTMRRLVAVGLAPELTRLTKQFTGLIVNNKDWIVKTVKISIETINEFTAAVGRLWPVLAAGAAVLLADTLAFSPWLITIGYITLALLAIDDLIVAYRGGKSVIQDFFKQFDIDIGYVMRSMVGFSKSFISEVGKMLNKLGEKIGELTYNILNSQIDYSKLFKDMGMLAAYFGDALIESIKDGFMKLIDFFPDWAKNLFSGKAKAVVSVENNTNKNPIDDVYGKDWLTNIMNSLSPASPDMSMVPAGAGPVRTYDNRTIQQNVTMDIRTTDPQKAGKSAADALQSYLKDAQNQTLKGERGGR
jgi:hypothetical protein